MFINVPILSTKKIHYYMLETIKIGMMKSEGMVSEAIVIEA
jgi:hypothetical protein